MVSDPGAQAVCLMFMLASVRVYIIDAFASPPPAAPLPLPNLFVSLRGKLSCIRSSMVFRAPAKP